MNADCQICKPEPQRPYVGIGTPIPMPGIRHRPDCPTLPHLTADQFQEYREFCDDVRRCQNEALRRAHSYVIGATS